MSDEEEGIVRTEGVVSGMYRVAGTRVRVIDVVESYQELGWSVEKIAEQYRLTPSQVLDALKFYYEHGEEVREELRSSREEVAA